MTDTLYADITDTSNVVSVQFTDSHTAQVSNVVITSESTSLDIGDSISVDIGYVGDHDVIFTGFVKSIEVKEPTKLYSITASNVLVRAMDYFIVAADQNNPFTRSNIKAEDLVEDVLALAGITNYTSDASNFTFAIHTPVEVNITSSYDYSKFIASLIAFSLYGDNNGLVHFENRRPYVMPGDVSKGNIGVNDLVDVSYVTTEKDLRNRIIVYGAADIHAEAKASSPYLPAGFYKSVLVAAPDVIDTQSMAQQSADYNLDLLNRLTISLSCSTIGDSSYQARDVYTVSIPDIGVSGKWYVYGITHDWSRAGFLTSMDLRS